MDKILKQILDEYYLINSKIFTPTRILILNLLHFHRDGLQFREMNESIKISDGNLYSNLEMLKNLTVIQSEKVQIDNKMLEIYTISEKGIQELAQIDLWLQKFKLLVK
ncbi:MAG: transcriptional regulator [Promethearchaeota archaeon]